MLRRREANVARLRAIERDIPQFPPSPPWKAEAPLPPWKAEPPLPPWKAEPPLPPPRVDRKAPPPKFPPHPFPFVDNSGMTQQAASSSVSEPEVTYEPEETSSVPTGTMKGQRSNDIANFVDASIVLDKDTEFSFYTNNNSSVGHLNRRCAASGERLPVATRSINYGAREVINWCPCCARVMRDQRLLHSLTRDGRALHAVPQGAKRSSSHSRSSRVDDHW